MSVLSTLIRTFFPLALIRCCHKRLAPALKFIKSESLTGLKCAPIQYAEFIHVPLTIQLTLNPYCSLPALLAYPYQDNTFRCLCGAEALPNWSQPRLVDVSESRAVQRMVSVCSDTPTLHSVNETNGLNHRTQQHARGKKCTRSMQLDRPLAPIH